MDPFAWNLSHDHRAAVPENLEHDRRSIVVDRGRLWSIVVDRAKIVAYFEALFEAKFKRIQPGFEATMPLSANRSHDALIPLPRPPLLA